LAAGLAKVRNIMKNGFLFLCAFTITSCSSSPYPHIDFSDWDRSPECCQTTGKKIAIASGGGFSSKAGLEIEESGGNIVDVAIASAFALAVERPHSLGLGGGGFLLFSFAGKKSGQGFVDFRETAPLAAKTNMYLDPTGKPLTQMSRYGILSVATPGFVPGLYFIHQRWGKLSWETLLQPAIRLARKGFPIYPSLAKAIREEKGFLIKQAYLKNIFFRHDEPLQKGDLLIQSDLADTLERISLNPKTELVSGLTATRIAEYMKQNGGLLSLSDLSSYRAKIRKPLRFNWRKKEFLLPPPPSAGGVITIQMLQMLSHDSSELTDQSSKIHLLAEVMKRAYADRAEFIGDPDFSKLNLNSILTRSYALKKRRTIKTNKASSPEEAQPLDSSKLRDRHTTHLSILDDKGNGISMTLTINDHFGSRLAVPGTGFFLNDEMDDFSIQPGVPNLFGLIGSQANSIEPLKRPASSMTPTLVLDGKKAILAIGAAGGSRITSHVFQVLNSLFENPSSGLKPALFAPRIHHQWIPNELQLEKGFDSEIIANLRSLGHIVKESDKTALVQAVFRDSVGNLEAVFDPRDEGGAQAK
ncbi:MAG: gamma-glutamyltransferase, partial [Pseudomonadota bacterium]